MLRKLLVWILGLFILTGCNRTVSLMGNSQNVEYSSFSVGSYGRKIDDDLVQMVYVVYGYGSSKDVLLCEGDAVIYNKNNMQGWRSLDKEFLPIKGYSSKLGLKRTWEQQKDTILRYFSHLKLGEAIDLIPTQRLNEYEIKVPLEDSELGAACSIDIHDFIEATKNMSRHSLKFDSFVPSYEITNEGNQKKIILSIKFYNKNICIYEYTDSLILDI